MIYPVRYVVVERSQPSKQGRSGFRGPDTYVAVVRIPSEMDVVPPLTADAEKRGVFVVWRAVGYRALTGPRSALGRARATAANMAARFNSLCKPRLP